MPRLDAAVAAEIAFRRWFNETQPLLNIQEGSTRFVSAAQTRMVQNMLRAAYLQGWLDCARAVKKAIGETDDGS